MHFVDEFLGVQEEEVNIESPSVFIWEELVETGSVRT